MKTLIVRIVKILVIAEILYLLLINVALNLPLTQSIVNQIKPEKFTVTWSGAWSPYPFRVYAHSIFANGQSGSQQWQAQSPAASASISLASLIWHTVRLHNIVAEDVKYYQRPSPQSGKDFSDIRAHFPTIEGHAREVHDVADQASEKKQKTWHINIDDIQTKGRHELWLYNMQTLFSGTLQTNLSFQTQGGPFALNKGKVDINLHSLVLNGDHEVIREGLLKGEVELQPFVAKKNKGLKALSFLDINAEIHTETESLAFLNFYLDNYEGIQVDGAGFLQGRLQMQQGELLDGTDIKVSARKLSLDLFDLAVEGNGNIRIKAVENDDSTDVSVTFLNLDAFAGNGDVVLFSGNELTVEAQGNRSILPETEKPFQTKRLAMTIPSVNVPDLSAYQLFVPDKWPISLHAGAGHLQGTVEMTPNGLNGTLKLGSNAAEIGINEYRFTSNLDMALNVDSPALTSGVDISGTYVSLYGTQVSSKNGQSSAAWHSRVDIEHGKLKLLLPEDISADSGFRKLYQGLKGKEIATMIDSGDEEIHVTASISDLSWLNVLLKNRLGLAINGSGDIAANIILNKGWPAAGTKIEIHPQTLGVEVLDYVADGVGEVTLQVVKGGENPDASLSITLKDGVMRRKDEEQAYIEKVVIRLHALARGISFDGEGKDIDLHLEIPSATVADMTVYNQYLPVNTPMDFTGGAASFFADVKLTPDTAKGRVHLQTEGLSARVDQQEIEGEVTTDITLIDGVPERMDFDISGSAITLDRVKVLGKEGSHNDDDWSAVFELKKARAVWKRPVEMHLEADVEMTDSKPIVAVIANQRGKHGWLEKALTIDDVKGQAVIYMAKKHITVPYAYAASDNIDVGVKGVITPDERNGVFYVRFRKLDGILKINNGKRNLDLLNAREKFDEFDSEKILLRMNKTNSLNKK